MPFSRRLFLSFAPLVLPPAFGLVQNETLPRPHARLPPTAPPLFVAEGAQGQTGPGDPADSFPAHDPKTVAEMVTVSHGNVARVRELLSNRPALANAAWDWGFGDWETALGAASHVGNREIAALLLGAGARPSIFSAAMLGQLEVVKAFVAAAPGIQRTRGPHGIPLLAHAKAGGAAEVVKYLESVPDSNVPYRNEPMTDAARAACVGTYRFGPAPAQEVIVSTTERGALMIRRAGGTERAIFHLGDLTFHPMGAEGVRIRFSTGTPAASLTIDDGPVRMTARRV
jgi:hypothetical protein